MTPFSGGMEHQTMTSQGFFEFELNAHELGHQWWGDHVTCASWKDIFINAIGFTNRHSESVVNVYCVFDFLFLCNLGFFRVC
jgi:hypothetical protein